MLNKFGMKKLNVLVLLIATLFLIGSCSTKSNEQGLAELYEAQNGALTSVNNFEFIGSFTYSDSVKIWQEILDEKKAAFLARMDSAEASLNRSTKLAKDGLERNTFAALKTEFEKTIKDNERIQLRIDINKEMANTTGGDTQLAKYYGIIENLKLKGDEVIYNMYRGDANKRGEIKTKLYYFDKENTKVIRAEVE